MTDKEELTRGEALARVAVLEAEVAELRGRVCVPEGWRVVPVEPTEAMLQAADAADREYTDRSFGSGHPLVQQGPYDHWCAMLAAAPAPVERCDTCYGHGEVPTGETQRFGDLQPPEPIMMACPECDGQAPLERLATDGGRNQRFEGLFEGETLDQRDARLASAAPVERVEQYGYQAIFNAIAAATKVHGSNAVAISVEAFRKSLAQDTPHPAPTAAQDVAGLVEALQLFVRWVDMEQSENVTAGVFDRLKAFRNAESKARAVLAAHQSGGAK